MERQSGSMQIYSILSFLWSGVCEQLEVRLAPLFIFFNASEYNTILNMKGFLESMCIYSQLQQFEIIGHLIICILNHSFSLTRSLSYSSNFFILCPLKFFISHRPTSIALLFLTNYYKLFSNQVASISPVTFLHCGLLMSSRMASTRTYSFSSVSLILSMSEASRSSSIFMSSRMLRSDSLKASSTSLSISSLSALSSLVSTFDIFLRNQSMRQLILPTSVLSFKESDYRHWADYTLAAQKVVAQLSRPLQNLLLLSGFEKSNFYSGFLNVAR